MSDVITQFAPVIGRRKIYIDETEITEQNVTQIVSYTLLRHQENAAREHYLYEYEKGAQPILDREKKIRPEINEKVLENNAAKIVDVHLAYDFSNPLTYVRKTKAEGKAKESFFHRLFGKKEPGDDAYVLLNQMMQSVSKAKKDVVMGHNLMCGGLAYKMAWPARNKDAFAPFDYMIPDPRTTYVVYFNNVYQSKALGVTYNVNIDGTITLTAYTAKNVFRFERDVNGVFATPKILPNVLGVIPIVEYELPDRMGVFEKVIDLLNAANLLSSDRMNDLCQHVQSILWMNNAELDADQKDEMLSGKGIIMTKSQEGRQADIKYLSQVLDQSQVQTFANYLNDQILQITSTPSWQEASGGSTTGAMQLSNGWQSLELSAKTVEMMYDESEREWLEVVLACIRRTEKKYDGLENINIDDIDIKFNRNKTFDLVSKTNALATLLNSGIYGLDAINTVNLFTDPQMTWENSKETINGIQKKLKASENGSGGNSSQGSANAIPNANAAVDENGNGGVNNDPKQKTEESLQPSKVAGTTE